MNETSKKFALTGMPLSHSLSPFIHERLTETVGITASYSLIEAAPDALESVFKSTLFSLDGFNVTIPHKLGIIPLLDSLSDRAELYGSVNTVVFENGRAVGHNTDCTGFLRSLELGGIELFGDVLVTGCGGVSRMFAFESALKGAAVTLAVRESGTEKAKALADEIKLKTGRDVKTVLLGEAVGAYNLIINGTPVGMHPRVNASVLPESVVKEAGAVFDAIYNPAETLLLKYAKENGIKYMNGLYMLVLQAAEAETLWNGVSFGADILRRVKDLTEKELNTR
ncbi:MAG: shikimate dehydrogenase [Eubacterium sp.]|nr:shikimate dehydrogenase [Eubacterium sp.]